MDGEQLFQAYRLARILQKTSQLSGGLYGGQRLDRQSIPSS
jgi:hypothetical protein